MKIVVSLFMVFFCQHLLADNKKLSVFVGIPPQAYFVERIAGDLVELHTLMPAAQNPVSYEPRPQQLKQLHDADVFFLSGVPFEEAWFKDRLKLPATLNVIECCDEIELIEDAHEHTGHHVDHIEFDPHYWTSPKHAKIIATTIFKTLSEYLPEQQTDLHNNYSDLFKELDDLNEYIHSRFAVLTQRRFMISHPAWGYFSKDYELEQISLEQNGKSIRARQIIKYIELAKSLNMRAVFSQPQFNQEAAELIAKGAAIEVIELDPMHKDYINNLYGVTENILKGLQ